MSTRTVGIVMSRLLTDEDLRVRFAIDRVEALGELNSELHANGLRLTPSEIDLFIESDVRIVVLDRSSNCRSHTLKAQIVMQRLRQRCQPAEPKMKTPLLATTLIRGRSHSFVSGTTSVKGLGGV